MNPNDDIFEVMDHNTQAEFQNGETENENNQPTVQKEKEAEIEPDLTTTLSTIENLNFNENHGSIADKRDKWLICTITNSAGNVLKRWFAYNRELCFLVAGYLLFGALTAYVTIALMLNFERATPLLAIWCCFVGFKIYAFNRDMFGKVISASLKPAIDIIKEHMCWIKWVLVALLIVGLAIWIALDTSKRPNQLISGVGYLFFLFCLFITSTHPSQVKWRPVLWGLFIQISLALIILRTKSGFQTFNGFAKLVEVFMDFVNYGVIFLFGPGYAEHFFAFKVLSTVMYFGAFISILYYFGVIQWILIKIAWLMQISLGTSATETVVAAGNLFTGLSESALTIKPFVEDLTSSELFAVMVSGFATVAGSTLGAYMTFGIDAVYLITACFMSSPCALAVAKLSYPETQRSKFMDTDIIAIEKSCERNMIDAAAQGASVAISLVLSIGANLIVFISLLALVNATLSWFGGLVDFPQLTFEFICSYLFMPATFLMGIEWDDCFKSAELVGVGIFLNEFVAYDKLASLKNVRNNGTIPKFDLASGSVNWIEERSEAIMTYALCGFANVGSIGIMLGGLGTLAPSRRSEMAEIVVKATLVGTVVNLLNACVAGFLYVPRPIFCDNILATTYGNYSVPSRLYECCSAALDRADNSSIICNCCAYNWNATMFNLNCSMTAC